MTNTVPNRKFLVDGLHEALAHLEKVQMRHPEGGHPYLLLQRLIEQCADEQTLERMLSEVKQEIERLEASVDDPGLLTETRERNHS